MNETHLYQLLEQTHAILKGHFLLTSGLHSGTYLQCARLTQYPDVTAEIAQALAGMFTDSSIDLVIGPAIGGIILAYETARALNVPAIFAERENGRMQLRRGFEIKSGQKMLVTEDVTTTGGSVRDVIELVHQYDGHVIGVGSIIDRSAGQVDFGAPFQALLTLQLDTFQSNACPLCAQGQVLVKPGSRAIIP